MKQSDTREALDDALDHLRALLAIIHQVEQAEGGGFCLGCHRHISHSHGLDCPRQAAAAFVEGLE